LIGIDGCRGGWLIAVSDAAHSALRFAVVDAVACLVAARRIAEGKARVLPGGGVEHDSRWLRMEIVA
jgi:hypothetical protein